MHVCVEAVVVAAVEGAHPVVRSAFGGDLVKGLRVGTSWLDRRLCISIALAAVEVWALAL